MINDRNGKMRNGANEWAKACVARFDHQVGEEALTNENTADVGVWISGFKCLIYMHRYRTDTIARIRTDYVHEQQSRYRAAIAYLEKSINGSAASDRVRLNKQLTKLQAQAGELRIYEEKKHHLAEQMISIDLDDGVKHNYVLFQDVLAKIKQGGGRYVIYYIL